jgi:hypothetical protein
MIANQMRFWSKLRNATFVSLVSFGAPLLCNHVRYL